MSRSALLVVWVGALGFTLAGCSEHIDVMGEGAAGDDDDAGDDDAGDDDADDDTPDDDDDADDDDSLPLPYYFWGVDG